MSSTPPARRRPPRSAATLRAVFGNRNMAAMLLLGFSSGLPLALSSGTLQAWLTVRGASLQAIGLATLIGQAYVFKFLWAPMMDRVQLPGLAPRLGRRRAWLLPLQALLALVLVGMAWVGIPDAAPGSSQRASLLPVVLLAVALAFLSASQDVVIDAYRTDLLPSEQRGAGAAVIVLGYRLGMVVSGGLALWLATDWLGWRGMYALMGVFMALGMLSTWWAPRPPASLPAPSTLRAAVLEPAREFFARPQALALLVAVVLYKLGDAFAGALSTTFLIRGAGYSPAAVGLVYKSVGLLATIVGALLGGAWLARLGLWRSLLLFGIAQGASNLAYWGLAVLPASLPLMAGAVGVENFTAGMGTAAFVAWLSALCDVRYSATQFALLSALSAVGRVYVGPLSGWLVLHLGWPHFFLFSVLSALPGLLLLIPLRRGIEQRDAAQQGLA